jgi:hypothetical protein
MILYKIKLKIEIVIADTRELVPIIHVPEITFCARNCLIKGTFQVGPYTLIYLEA